MQNSTILSNRAKFAIKTAIAVTLSYMIPLALGWGQPNQGAIAIMVIASAGALQESLEKGVMRVVGTVAGAVVGLGLIALFAQDRAYYLLTLSIIMAIVAYLYYAYKGEKTFWMIMLVVLVMIYSGDDVDDKFVYALDKSWSTAFGIFVYAMVNIYLWPTKNSKSTTDIFEELLQLWQNGTKGDIDNSKLQSAKESFKSSIIDGVTDYIDTIAFDKKRWIGIYSEVDNINRVFEKLYLLEYPKYKDTLNMAVPNISKAVTEIEMMIREIREFVKSPSVLTIYHDLELEFDTKYLSTLTPLQRVHIVTLQNQLTNLHSTLTALTKRLNSILSFEPDINEIIPTDTKINSFNWSDIDNIKATIVSMLLFWSGVGAWIYINTPQGYTVASLAFIFSLITTFTPINPLALIFVYTLSFIFSFITYVWVLPQLGTGVELGLYMFVYMFITYYLIPTPLALFFAMGLIFQFIVNDMIFSFEAFITLLLVFYLFLGFLLIFYYIPFSNRAESMFKTAEERFKKVLIDIANNKVSPKLIDILYTTITKMRVWSSKIDYSYFSGIKSQKLQEYISKGERVLVIYSLILPMYKRVSKNRLFDSIEKIDTNIGKELEMLTNQKIDKDILLFRLENIQKSIDNIITTLKWREYSYSEIAEVAEFVTLKKLLIESIVQTIQYREELKLTELNWSRF